MSDHAKKNALGATRIKLYTLLLCTLTLTFGRLIDKVSRRLQEKFATFLNCLSFPKLCDHDTLGKRS